MRTKLKELYNFFIVTAAYSQKLGINLIRVAILVIFVWIGALKFYNYEAEGIVPFVANSPGRLERETNPIVFTIGISI